LTNKIHDAFDSVEANEELKSSTARFLREEREKRGGGRVRRPAWRTTFAAVCAMAALLVGVGGYYYTTRTPVSYVSIDVNPSVELALNRYDRVVSAAAYNEDGVIVLDGVDVKGELYTEAIDTIVESEAMRPYLTANATLTFTVAAGDSDKESAIMTGIENCDGCQEHGGQSYTADVTSIAAAHDRGLSFGKYAAYLVLSQYDNTITTEDCQSMSMAEIRERIREQEGGECDNEDHGTCNGENNGANKGGDNSGQNGSGNAGEGDDNSGGNCDNANGGNGQHYGQGND